MKKELRIIVDTNIWISFLIGRKLSRFMKIISHPDIRLVFSNESFEELYAVTQRPKFAKYFETTDKTSEFVGYLKEIGLVFHLPEMIPPRCRDPKDDYLLELAVVSKADFIITGDKDLLTIAKVDNCRIVTVMEFDMYWNVDANGIILNEPDCTYGYKSSLKL